MVTLRHKFKGFTLSLNSDKIIKELSQTGIYPTALIILNIYPILHFLLFVILLKTLTLASLFSCIFFVINFLLLWFSLIYFLLERKNIYLSGLCLFPPLSFSLLLDWRWKCRSFTLLYLYCLKHVYYCHLFFKSPINSLSLLVLKAKNLCGNYLFLFNEFSPFSFC